LGRLTACIQTCKTFYEVEKRQHTAIWKLCAQTLIDEAALFPPTLTWRSPYTKVQEQLLRRAFYFKKAIHQYQNAKLKDPAPRRTAEFKLPEDFLDLTLLPGGRFLLAMGADIIALFDLAPYYEAGSSPSQIASFKCSIRSDQLAAASRRIVTFAGEEEDRVRVMLAYATDPEGLDSFRTD
jgi:hypothetical protein